MTGFFYQWAVILFAVLMVASAVEDYLGTRIPNRLCLAALALYPFAAIVSPVPVDWVVALMIAFGVFAAGAALYALNTLGGGDVKLLAVLALWAGPALIFEAVLVTAVAGGLLAVAAMRVPGLARSPLDVLATADPSLPDATLPAPPSGTPSLKQTIPYGIAIAAGGLWVAGTMFWSTLAAR